MREFDNAIIQTINEFEKITGSKVRDCINGDFLCFLVNEGEAGVAIGRGGQAIKKAEKLFKKQIKIYEFSDNTEQFIKNLVPGIENIVLNNGEAKVTVSAQSRGAAIGKSGANIKVIRELLERNSSVKKLRIV